MIELNKVRVVLGHNWKIEPPWYIQECIGKTGTVVLAEGRLTSKGYACDVELDKPHSSFGKFVPASIDPGDRIDLVATLIEGDANDLHLIARAFRLVEGKYGNGWGLVHDEKGKPLPWELTKPILEEALRKDADQ